MKKIKLNVVIVAVLIFYITLLSSCKSTNKNQSGENQKNHINDTSISQIEPFDVWSNFTASGWMGDGERGTKYINFIESSDENPHSSPYCVRIQYLPGPIGWAGIYWQNRPDNWGDLRGENFSDSGYTKITFWARGEKGDEVVEFKAGGIDAPGKRHKDSFEVSIGKKILSNEWEQFIINLKDKDLSNVIGGFCWVASISSNPSGLTFYLDDIQYE